MRSGHHVIEFLAGRFGPALPLRQLHGAALNVDVGRRQWVAAFGRHQGPLLTQQNPVDFRLTAHRDEKAALRFFHKAVRQHGLSEKVTIDKSGANTAALEALKAETGATIEIRQNKYLNNLVEQDHRAVKRIVRPMLGFKSFPSARLTLAGIELMPMLKKGQMILANGQKLSAAEQFYSLAA
jgi:hypothetical protein